MTFNIGDVVSFREDRIRENNLILNIENRLEVLATTENGKFCYVDAKLTYPYVNKGKSRWGSGWFTLCESSRGSLEDML